MKPNLETDELKWYEKKAGINSQQKNAAKEKKEIRKQRRAQEAAQEGAQTSKQANASTKKSENKNSNSPKPQTRHEERKANRQHSVATCLDSLFDTSSIPSDSKAVLEDFQQILLSVTPLNSKQRSLLPKQIRDLSHTLTDERDERRKGYMNETTTLSAYIHYFLWWNLVRLTKLFANLPESFFKLKDEDIALDIGSGPLTVPIALFLARPELRTKKITFYCMDISQQTLNAGENIFLATAAKLKCEPWKIIRIRGNFETEIKEKASLVTCANVFNEVLQGQNMPPEYHSKKYSQRLLSYSEKNAYTKILIVEPGVPSSARFLHCIRDNFMAQGFKIVSPCTHHENCPMLGKKGKGAKWCNFAFTTEDAPVALKKLSEAAELPKDRAVLSYLAVEKNAASQAQVKAEHILEMLEESQTGNKKLRELNSQANGNALTFRVVSDRIALPGQRNGWYACSDMGLLLVVANEMLHSGESYSCARPKLTPPTDKKSGALIINLR